MEKIYHEEKSCIFVDYLMNYENEVFYCNSCIYDDGSLFSYGSGN